MSDENMTDIYAWDPYPFDMFLYWMDPPICVYIFSFLESSRVRACTHGGLSVIAYLRLRLILFILTI